MDNHFIIFLNFVLSFYFFINIEKSFAVRQISSEKRFVQGYITNKQANRAANKRSFQTMNQKGSVVKGQLKEQKTKTEIKTKTRKKLNNKVKTDTQGQSLNDLWTTIPLFKNKGIILYYLKRNPDIIVSVSEQKGISLQKLSQSESLFNQSEREKKSFFSNLPMKKRKLHFSVKKLGDNSLILYSKGSYIDASGKKVLFEDWNFYHIKTTLHFLIHSRPELKRSESSAIRVLLKKIILSNKNLSDSDKRQVIKNFEKIRQNAVKKRSRIN